MLGRPAASLPDFRYSGPLRRGGIVWTADRLKAFVSDPQAVVPSTRISFAGASLTEAERIVVRLLSPGAKAR